MFAVDAIEVEGEGEGDREDEGVESHERAGDDTRDEVY